MSVLRSRYVALCLTVIVGLGAERIANSENIELDQQLRSLPRSNWTEAGLRADFAPPDHRQVEQGGTLNLTVDVDVQAHIAVALVDALGQVIIFVPHRSSDGDGDVAYPQTTLTLPNRESNESLYAAMAPGAGKVVVIASPDPVFSVEPIPNHPLSIQNLIGMLKNSQVALRSLDLWVTDPRPRDLLSKDEIVSFFTVQTRGVKNAALGLRVGFDTNSATLDSTGRRQLESLGRGLSDPQLAGKRFMLEGYTDDRGTDAYNDALSEHRAQAVRQYLVKEMGVDASRLQAKGFGKSNPFQPGTSEEARTLNRRVVIRRLEPSS